MGVRECCVKRQSEEEKNLNKKHSNQARFEDDNNENQKNDIFFSAHTSEKNFFNNNYFNEKEKEEDILIKEEQAKKIQKNFRNIFNKIKFKNEIKPKIIEENKYLLIELYNECSKGGELPSDEDFSQDGWKKYYPSNERFFLYQKGKVFPNQIRIKNQDNINNLEIYEGEVNMDNLKHGFGILTTPQYKLIGTWRRGEFTGWGRKTMRNGDIMEGKFVNGKLNGKGIFKNLSCSYEGDFINSKKYGKGELKTQKYNYIGDFKDDLLDGEGSIEFLKEGSKYTGSFEKNEISGKGVFNWKNGDKYEGQMKKNKMDGFGRFTFNDGKIYEGEYKNGIKQGKGKLIYPGNKIFEGQFENGLPEGEGIYYENGKIYKVLFSRGNFVKYLDEDNQDFGNTL